MFCPYDIYLLPNVFVNRSISVCISMRTLDNTKEEKKILSISLHLQWGVKEISSLMSVGSSRSSFFWWQKNVCCRDIKLIFKPSGKFNSSLLIEPTYRSIILYQDIILTDKNKNDIIINVLSIFSRRILQSFIF